MTLTEPEHPAAPLQTESFRVSRPQIVGPEVPEDPFPIRLVGPVQKGFGRGGKELGCPTANLPDESIHVMTSVARTGVYYGYAQIIPPSEDTWFPTDDIKVLPMVMSLGWNPFYKNKCMTAEIHIMHDFKSDFYGLEMRTVVLGYIRPELDYTSREGLIDDIETDKKVALRSLERAKYQEYIKDPLFRQIE